MTRFRAIATTTMKISVGWRQEYLARGIANMANAAADFLGDIGTVHRIKMAPRQFGPKINIRTEDTHKPPGRQKAAGCRRLLRSELSL